MSRASDYVGVCYTERLPTHPPTANAVPSLSQTLHTFFLRLAFAFASSIS